MGHRFALMSVLTGCFVLLSRADGQERLARAAAPWEKVVAADTIVLGKVVAFEDKEVEAAPFVGAPNKFSYRVASLKIDDALLGAKGLTHVRVGFVPRGEGGGANGADAQPVGIRLNSDVQLRIGQEGCFFLTRHPVTDFLTVPPFAAHADKKSGDFGQQLEFIRRAAKLLADPPAALKSKEVEDRFLTAALLVHQYRRPLARAGFRAKEVPIPAEESKHILSAIYDADWTKKGEYLLSPNGVFDRLSVQPTDGFRYPKAQPGEDWDKQVAAVARPWLKEHLESYRVKRWVLEEKKDEPK